MFIARSVARIRRARLAFFAAGLVPTVALASWAVYLRSDAHRLNVERRWQEAVGLPLVIGRIEHPKPGVTRAYDCVVPPREDHPAVTLPMVELESSADEDRIRISEVAFDAGIAAVGFDIAGRWLTDDTRFRRSCVVEIGQLHWPTSMPNDKTDPFSSRLMEKLLGPSGGSSASREADEQRVPPETLRVECVLHDASRAIRIVRRGSSDDEVRIVRHSQEQSDEGTTYDVDATIATPIPMAILATLAGSSSAGLTLTGHDATVSGTLKASCTKAGWQGEARGNLNGIDLATVAAAVGDRASGVASAEISRLVWSEGRVRDALVEATVGSGFVDRRLFDRVVLALAARPGVAASRVPPTQPLSFDAAACIVAIGPHGVQVQPTPRVPAGLATIRGEVLLAAPVGPVTADRIAWLLSSPGTTFGPTAGPGAWLMSVLPPLGPNPAPTDSDRRF